MGFAPLEEALESAFGTPSRRFSSKLLQVERPPVIIVIAGVMQGMSNVAQAFVEQAAAPLSETVVPVEDVLTVMDDADAVGMSVLDSFAPLEEALERVRNAEPPVQPQALAGGAPARDQRHR